MLLRTDVREKTLAENKLKDKPCAPNTDSACATVARTSPSPSPVSIETSAETVLSAFIATWKSTNHRCKTNKIYLIISECNEPCGASCVRSSTACCLVIQLVSCSCFTTVGIEIDDFIAWITAERTSSSSSDNLSNRLGKVLSDFIAPLM